MDIKNVLNSMILPNPVPIKSSSEKAIKMDSTTDRDGNGQMSDRRPEGGGEEPLSEEDWILVLKHFKGLSAVKEHGWIIEKITLDQRHFILIRDGEGKVLKRISERDLSALLLSIRQGTAAQETRGQLLRRQA